MIFKVQELIIPENKIVIKLEKKEEYIKFLKLHEKPIRFRINGDEFIITEDIIVYLSEEKKGGKQNEKRRSNKVSRQERKNK